MDWILQDDKLTPYLPTVEDNNEIMTVNLLFSRMVTVSLTDVSWPS